MTPSKFAHLLVMLLIALAIGAVPADAHKKKHPEQAAPVSNIANPPASDPTVPASSVAEPSKGEHMAGVMEEEAEARASMSAGQRLLDWLGRLHPVVVHFPIAFFPAALFTAIVGRRRPAFVAPVQFLVIAGGIIAPIAAILGWFDAMTADPAHCSRCIVGLGRQLELWQFP